MIDFKKYHLEISDKKANFLIKIFSFFSFFVCLIGIFLLWKYNYSYPSIELYKSSLIIFRTGLLIHTFSIICGIFFCNYEYLR